MTAGVPMRPWLLAIAIWAAPVPLAAQDEAAADVTEARAALEAGDLIGAGTAIDRGLTRAVLPRETLAELYVLRALLAYSDDRLGLLEESLQALASLEAPVSPLFPPPLRARYEEVRATASPLSVAVEIVPAVEGDRRSLRLAPRTTHDPGNLVRTFRLRAAIDEAALADYAEGTLLDGGDAHAAVDVQYVLEALGPGGVIVARRGAPDAPHTETLDALPVDETFLHVTLVTVASVVVAGAIAVSMAYLATDGFTAGQSTTLSPATCTGAPCALVSF